MDYGLWIMVYGLWFMVYDFFLRLWFKGYGLWFMDYGLWFMVYGLCLCFLCEVLLYLSQRWHWVEVEPMCCKQQQSVRDS